MSPNDPVVYPVSCNALCVAHLAGGRYEEALSIADRALSRNAGVSALRLKLCLLGHLGRHEAASECLRRLSETYSEPTVATLMHDMPKGQSPELAAHMAEGLRKAGLPEG